MNRWCRLATGAWLLGATLVSVGCTKSGTASTVIPGEGMAIEFRSESNPPTSGDNTFEVAVRRGGAPVIDATVTAVFSMPAMPSMNMPEMHSNATLAPQGEGRYRGTGQLSMAGTWNVVITVSRGTEELGSHRLSLVAK